MDRDAWWARNEPCPVVVAYGIDPILFMVGAQVFGSQESELEVAGGMLGDFAGGSDFLKNNQVIAAAPGVFASLRQAIAAARA